MNSALKKVLIAAREIGEALGASMIPGGAQIISGVEKLVDKDKTNNWSAVDDLGDGTLKALEFIKGKDLVDETVFMSGYGDIKQGFEKIKLSFKKQS